MLRARRKGDEGRTAFDRPDSDSSDDEGFQESAPETADTPEPSEREPTTQESKVSAKNV